MRRSDLPQDPLPMIIALSLVLGAFQDPLAQVQANETRRVGVVSHCAPAVCSVMSMDAPGGGSGVIFDPTGFVLTNYPVVGEPDDDYKPPRAPALPAKEGAVAQPKREKPPLFGGPEVQPA